MLLIIIGFILGIGLTGGIVYSFSESGKTLYSPVIEDCSEWNINSSQKLEYTQDIKKLEDELLKNKRSLKRLSMEYFDMEEKLKRELRECNLT